MSFQFRRSETVEQENYEKEIHNQHHHCVTVASKHNGTGLSKTALSGEHERSHRGKKFFTAVKRQLKASFPEAIQDVKIMAGFTALETRVKKEIQNPRIFPEIARVAQVRTGTALCHEELAFLSKRKLHVRDAFAQYFNLKAEEIHPDDVPTISFGGSGGGFRAMIGCLAYCEAMKQAGLWDCLTYVSGVSGSCWSLAAYYTFGQTSMQNVIDHCKSRLSPHHPLSGEAVRTVLSTPGGARTTLGPLIQKHKSGLEIVAMDLYSVFTTGWIFLQHAYASRMHISAKSETTSDQSSWYRYSSVRKYTDNGTEPLPIFTAIRHERPWKDWVDKEHAFNGANHSDDDHDDESAWFQWFEMTPYEIGCDEIAAWVPTWAFGRPFSEGKSTMQLPEQSLALLLGLCTSAPAGPLTSYLATICRSLPPGFLGNSIHSLGHGMAKLWGKRGTEQFQNHHPLHACNEHNFLYHFTLTPANQPRPPGLENSPRLHLIDSGMDNNCPTYVLLHPSRQADVIINMDASSDVQKDSFPDRVNQIANRKGLHFTKRSSAQPPSHPIPSNRYSQYAQIYDGVPIARPETVVDSYGRTVPTPPAPVYRPEQSEGKHGEGNAMGEVSMAYMPLLPNEAAVKGFDPCTAKFSGSYNLVWTPEQVQMLVDVCSANFREGEETVRSVLWEAYLRRRAKREGRDEKRRQEQEQEHESEHEDSSAKE